MKSAKALKSFFKTCKVCLFEDVLSGHDAVDGWNDVYTRRLIMHMPFKVSPVWKFKEAATIHGYAIVSDDDKIIHQECFSSAPYIIPLKGGTIEVKLHKITFGDFVLGDLFKKRLKISEAMLKRIVETFSEYGVVQGVVATSVTDGQFAIGKDAEDAINLFFSTNHPVEDLPKVFESWPVIYNLDKIVLQGEKEHG